MARTSNRFTKGTGVFACRACGYRTRDTGRGDNEGVGMCGLCYDLSGEENHLSDNGGTSTYDSPVRVLQMIEDVAARGDASGWAALKSQVETLLNTPKGTPEMNAAEILKAKMPALIAFYNAAMEALGKKPVKKFADLATARKRCIALLPKDEQPAAKKAKAAPAPKEKAAPLDAASRGAIIAKTWTDSETRTKRLQRTSVKVRGHGDFASVRAAFLAIGLPLSRHIRFRVALKADTGGGAVFEHEGKKYQFTAETVQVG